MLVASCASKPPGSRGVLFAADDGTVLHGRIYAGSGAAVILIHDFDSNQGVWNALARTLTDRGFGVLTYDMRGHASSPGKKEVGIADSDAAAALRSLGQRQAFVIGEGLGGAAALRLAAREKVLGIVSISALSSFRGFSVASDIPRIDPPKLFIAAEGDAEAAQSARAFKERAKEPAELALVPGTASGAAMLSGDQGLAVRDRVLQFLDKNRPK